MEPEEIIRKFVESITKREESGRKIYTTTHLKLTVAIPDDAWTLDTDEIVKQEIGQKVFEYLYGEVNERIDKVASDLNEIVSTLMKNAHFSSYQDRVDFEKRLKDLFTLFKNILTPENIKEDANNKNSDIEAYSSQHKNKLLRQALQGRPSRGAGL